jgi:hypothetical protein
LTVADLATPEGFETVARFAGGYLLSLVGSNCPKVIRSKRELADRMLLEALGSDTGLLERLGSEREQGKIREDVFEAVRALVPKATEDTDRKLFDQSIRKALSQKTSPKAGQSNKVNTIKRELAVPRSPVQLR